MNLKHYLRGLGIGILVTAVIMTVAHKDNRVPMTEEEIKIEAEKLGMVDGTKVLADNEKEDKNTEADKAVEEGKNIEEDKDVLATAGEAKKEEEAKKAEEIKKAEEAKAAEEAKKKAEEEAKAAEEAKKAEEEKKAEKEKSAEENAGAEVTIVVQSGDGSRTVANKLEEAGIIKSAAEYDQFLCANGYDKRLCTGSHTIKIGATDEEIAKILMTRKK